MLLKIMSMIWLKLVFLMKKSTIILYILDISNRVFLLKYSKYL